MAIAWIYRSDYARAGFPMATVVDPTGKAPARQALLCSISLFLCSLLPTVLGYTSSLYAVVAAIAGAWYIFHAIQFYQPGSRDIAARNLFFVSIVYLPLVLAVLVTDRLLIG